MGRIQECVWTCLVTGILCLAAPGCQNEASEPGLEPIPLPATVAFEGPGFTFEIPETWEAFITGRKVTVQPKGSAGEAHVSLELDPYGPGETPENTIEAIHQARSGMKGSIESAKTRISGFPAFRQIYRHNGNGKNPDRIFHLVGIPEGKLSALASLKNGRQMSDYFREFQSIVYSVRGHAPQ